METFEAGGKKSKESNVVKGHLDYEEISSETSAMRMKQELQDSIEEYKFDIEEHFYPNEDVRNNHTSIIVKNERTSIKHEEEVDLGTDHSEQTFIGSNSKINQVVVDGVSKKCDFIEIEDSVQSKKAMEVKQELHDPIEDYGIDIEENALLDEDLCNNHASDVVKNEWVSIKRKEEVYLGIDHSERGFIGDLVLVDGASQKCDYIEIEDYQQLEEDGKFDTKNETEETNSFDGSIYCSTDEEGFMADLKNEFDQRLQEETQDSELVFNTQQSSQWSQSIFLETGHNLNTKHTINVMVNDKKKERQQRYREQNREKLKQREAERRERIRNLQRIARPSSSPNIHRIELNNEEIITANSKSTSGLKGPQPSIQRNEQAEEKDALERKRERQQRYRERNREKLKQRNRERRERLRYKQIIATINRIELNNEEMITALSQSSSGLEETQTYIQINEQAKENNALQRKRERQQRYRERNREKLIQRNRERRERRRYVQIIPEPSTVPNVNRIELNNEEIVTAISQSSSGLEGPQTYIQKNEQAKENNALQRKRERQQRYRERNRDKLKQREAERRRRLQNEQYRFYRNNK